MRFFKKENKIQELMEQQVEVVSRATNHWKEAFLFYLKGDRKNFEDEALATIQLETRADDIRKETQLMLYR